MNKYVSILIVLIVTLAIIFGFVYMINKPSSNDGKLDEFAKCIAEQEFTMYGTYWCSHCKDQKNDFGTSFQYVPYVECSEEAEKCVLNKIEYTPTWIAKSGEKYVGRLPMEKISEITGCKLPE